MSHTLTLVAALLFAPLAALHGTEPAARARRAPDPALAPIKDVAGLPRVLLIGDSVSMGYTVQTRELLHGEANVHRPPTNCSSSGNGIAHLKSWLGDTKWDVIHFNFGLHDAKLPPEGERHAPLDVYEKNLRELVKQMRATGAKLIFATTTPVPNGGFLRPTRRFGSVDQYNAVALEVMRDMDVVIDDLNAAIAPHVATMQRPNDVHFSDEGSALLAESVAASIVAALGLPARPPAAGTSALRPNVIFILADDQGWGDAGYSGHPYARTPNLDRLAADGTVIHNFYVNGPVCSPSRVAFMTGQYPARLGFHHITSKPDVNRQRQVPDWLNPDVTTIADVFKQAGYVTAHFGKWHLGKFGDSPVPSAYGFDRAAVHSGPGEQLRDRQEVSNEDPFLMTQLSFDRAIEFIREPRDAPFFLHVWSSLPHAPLRPSPTQREAYRDLKPDSEHFGKWMGDYIEAARSPAEQMKTYLAAIAEVDRQVGRLREALTELNLVDNTVIVFSSDNGPEDYVIGNASNAGLGSPGSLRGRKRSLYEGGIRVPFIAAWPGRIPAGHTDDRTIMSGADLMPTLAALAGIRCNARSIDGEDLSGALRGAPAMRRNPLHWEWFFEIVGDPDFFAPPLAMRDGPWKFYCDYAGGSVQLFDVARDPSEVVDLSAQHPDVIDRLRTAALDWVESLPPAELRTAVANGADRMKLLDIREPRKER
jgi:arylsulfatase A-like enzyme/lysophospholipase L1-like esterase